MKVICDRGALLDAVNIVSGVVATRTPKPQLTCIKITATDDADNPTLVLAATDAEISMRMATPEVEVQQAGEALIPADKLRQIISAEDAEATLTLEGEGEAIHIRGRDAHFKVYGYPATDFPDIDTPGSSDATLTLPAHTLDRLIDRTIFSTARENSRYALNGVLLRRDGKKIEMVATDSRRLALARATASKAPDGSDNCIIPTKALNTVRKLAQNHDGDVRIAITDTQAIFFFDEDATPEHATILASNLVEGTFPPYEDVIPKDQDKRATFDVPALSSAVRRAALLTNEESRGVRMAFGAADSSLTLSSRAPQMGEAKINVEIAQYDGDDIEIGFNPAFITDALKVLDNDQVVIEMKAPNKPGLIKSGNDFTYVVMPVNLQ